MKTIRCVYLALVVLVLSAFGWTQAASPDTETGTFRLHKFEQPIGSETYTLTRSEAEVTLKSDFKFTDRGTEVPLTASLTMEKDLTPRDFNIKGKISRFSSIEDSVHGRNAG
ncbi:MAG TPA: amidohydrolase, partial [Candidatus Angelobacter sp.]|nr:amidohydrolase [Candidatus Angelobacter sp.]